MTAMQITWDLRELTYELLMTNILDKNDHKHLYTYSMIENTMHIHTCANNNNNDFFFFFFLHIYKYAYPEREQMNPKDDVDNK